MATYSTNAQLKLDTGQDVSQFMDSSLSTSEITAQKDNSRERAYNFINSRYLRGKTAIPATHITELKQAEIDLVILNLCQD